MSRVFNRVVRLALLPGIRDTQAGLKGFTSRAAELILPRVTVPGFGFDVELLYIARKHGLRIRQPAGHYRYEDEPSTVRFAADAVTMLRDLARIRWNDWRGRYGQRAPPRRGSPWLLAVARRGPPHPRGACRRRGSLAGGCG